jgi:3-dehydroquinate synthetase
MSRDKKNRSGNIRFVLPRSLGTVEQTDAAGVLDIRAVLAAL